TQSSEPKKPTLQESWDQVMKLVNNCDNDLVKRYKEDIDTLLVFTGLFSAVVTAFAIESFQWIQDDPADSTVVLLAQIAEHLTGQPSPVSSPPIHFASTSSLI
ncbi:hypothetical protein L218DRAFT_875692, partial [Marasmius fiardii PR-910]